MSIHKNNLHIVLLIILTILITGLFFYSMIPTVPKASSTKGTLTVLSRRVRRYVKLNNEIPHDLSNLPILNGFNNDIKDAWGNDIIYLVNNKEVTLTSLGRDGKIGGKGEDTDISEKFNAFENLDDPFCGLIFPQLMTYDTMSYIAERIEMFFANNDQLPEDIQNLPEKIIAASEHPFETSESVNKTNDHWGAEIIYKKIGPTKFRLLSYGEDLMKGGIGQDSDMERVFELNTNVKCVEIYFSLRD